MLSIDPSCRYEVSNAVMPAIAEPWSNGQFEEQVNTLKMVERHVRQSRDLAAQSSPNRRGVTVCSITKTASNPYSTRTQVRTIH